MPREREPFTEGYGKMKLKAVSGIMLTLLFVSMLTMAFNIQPVKASGPIYIRADGSVEGTTDISSADNVTYYFTDNIYEEIVVERDNIVVDGAGYTLQGTGNYTGISLVDRSNVTIKNAKITSFWHGIMLNMSSSNTIYGNTVAANNWHGIWIHESSNNTISGNNITRNDAYGILLAFSSNNIISGNVLKNNGVTGITGIRIDNYSNNNSIYSNIVTAQEYWGIELSYSSNNRISENNITNNERGVVIWFFSTNNTIDRNNIANNDYGIYCDDSSGNHVYHNNFMDNIQQVFDPYAPYEVNNWDDGYPSGGNYWDDYVDVDQYGGPYQNETGSDGIWDHPYVLDENNQDNYPLVPEFPSLIILPLFMMVTLLAAMVYKRKHSM